MKPWVSNDLIWVPFPLIYQNSYLEVYSKANLFSHHCLSEVDTCLKSEEGAVIYDTKNSPEKNYECTGKHSVNLSTPTMLHNGQYRHALLRSNFDRNILCKWVELSYILYLPVTRDAVNGNNSNDKPNTEQVGVNGAIVQWPDASKTNPKTPLQNFRTTLHCCTVLMLPNAALTFRVPWLLWDNLWSWSIIDIASIRSNSLSSSSIVMDEQCSYVLYIMQFGAKVIVQ